MRPSRGRPAPALVALALAAVLVLAACAVGTPPAPGSPGPAASPVPTPGSTAPASPAVLASPVEGRLVAIDSEGLTRVRGFTLVTAGGTEADFALGLLENGVAFPPGHLAEHLATSSPVRVFFREEGGERVVYRLEDADGD